MLSLGLFAFMGIAFAVASRDNLISVTANGDSQPSNAINLIAFAPQVTASGDKLLDNAVDAILGATPDQQFASMVANFFPSDSTS